MHVPIAVINYTNNVYNKLLNYSNSSIVECYVLWNMYLITNLYFIVCKYNSRIF